MRLNLLKSKKSVIAFCVVAMCSFIAGMVLFLYSPYQCELLDIYSNDKVTESVSIHILYNNMSLSDDMKLDIRVQYNLSANEKEDLLESLDNIGVTVEREWRFDFINSSGYYIKCKIEDICRLAEIDVIERIESGYIQTIPHD
jgi:hypothetical protein